MQCHTIRLQQRAASWQCCSGRRGPVTLVLIPAGAVPINGMLTNISHDHIMLILDGHGTMTDDG